MSNFLVRIYWIEKCIRLGYMPELGWFRNLKPVKRFKGRHAKFVGLMEHNVVKKSYHMEHRDIFEHEVYCMKRLQGLKFVPQILMIDDEKRVIYMTYCGKVVKNLSKYKGKIDKYLKIITDEFGVYHNDIRKGNVCIDKKGQIFLIDFGWSREFEGIGGYGDGKIGNPNTDVPLTKKDVMDFLKELYYSKDIDPISLKENIKDLFLRDGDPLDEIVLNHQNNQNNENFEENENLENENFELNLENLEENLENENFEVNLENKKENLENENFEENLENKKENLENENFEENLENFKVEDNLKNEENLENVENEKDEGEAKDIADGISGEVVMEKSTGVQFIMHKQNNPYFWSGFN